MNKKLLLFVVGAILAVPAFGDAERGVASRTNCDDARRRIDEINAIGEPTEDEAAELDELNARVRRDCTTRNIRAASGRANAAPKNTDADAADDAPSDDANVVVDAPEIETVTLDPAVVQQNLDAGLCADGTKPNKYGCCTDEIFRDMGGMNFACCPKSGGDCFPPISTK